MNEGSPVTPPELPKSLLSLKSWLFTPPTQSDRFARAGEVHADVLIIDLEDSVARSAKKEARETVLRYLAAISADHMPLALRVNSTDTMKDELTAAAKGSHLI
jgi:citrate lyase beta subunit